LANRPRLNSRGDLFRHGWSACLSGVVEVRQDVPMIIGGEVLVEAAGFPPLPSRVEKIDKQGEGHVSVWFKHGLDPAAHDRLIVKLYTGDYSQEIRRLDTPAIVGGLWKRAFGRVATNP
jgi:cellulose synthase (UDP-forming)